jgi:large subunit ribosomal protein L15
MKLHDLRPPDGSHKARTRVGRGIAAGKGKTAGRGTKGQKARAGGSIPPWFEGGQTPLHMRIPKLRGFKNRAKVVYEVVNVGAIAQRIEAGAFARDDAKGATPPKKGEQLTINADLLRAVGLVRDVRKPLKVLGGGELSTALFVVADAFTKSATEKIEAAGGAVSILEIPAESLPAIGVGEAGARTPRVARTAAGRAAADRKVDARAARDADTEERAAEAAAAEAASSRKRASKADAAPADEAPAAKPAAKGRQATADSETVTPADAETAAEPQASAEPEVAGTPGAEASTADASPETETDASADASADESA